MARWESWIVDEGGTISTVYVGKAVHIYIYLVKR